MLCVWSTDEVPLRANKPHVKGHSVVFMTTLGVRVGYAEQGHIKAVTQGVIEYMREHGLTE